MIDFLGLVLYQKCIDDHDDNIFYNIEQNYQLVSFT